MKNDHVWASEAERREQFERELDDGIDTEGIEEFLANVRHRRELDRFLESILSDDPALD
jgi:hypothetical protein